MSQTNKADAAVWIRNSGSVTCEIPQLLSPFAKIPAALAAVFSVFLVGMPTLFFLLLYLLGPKEMIEDPGFAMAPLIFLGFMCFFPLPVAIFILRWASLIAFGKTEIRIDHERLALVTKAGPFWKTCKCKLNELGGFRIEFSQMLEANKHLSERSSLVAVRKDGRALHLLRAYPDQIVNQLADQLPLKIEEITGLKPASERAGAGSLGSEVQAVGPTEVLSRLDKPIGSHLVVEDSGRELIIRIPKPGFLKKTSKAAKLVIAGFMLAEVLILGILVPALIAGKVNGDPAAGWVIVVVFTLLNLCIVLYNLSEGVRRGTLRVSERQLNLEEAGLFSRKQQTWEADAIKSVKVKIERHERVGQDGGVSYSGHLEVLPSGGEEEVEWFDNLEKSELEWMVTSIKDRLGLASD
ncbi:hypothetical protein N9B31_05895 [Mariniblastus sp.]|nr:hypothetical protein [Mariniblastus sp.]